MDSVYREGQEHELMSSAAICSPNYKHNNSLTTTHPKVYMVSTPVTATSGDVGPSAKNYQGSGQNGLSRDYDSTEDGRKRRKISQEPSPTAKSLTLPASRGQIQPQHPSANSEDEFSGVKEDKKMETTSMNVQEDESMLEPATQQTQARRRGRPPKPSTSSVQSKLFSSKLVENEESAKREQPNTPRSRQFSKNPTMKVSHDGKLFSPSRDKKSTELLKTTVIQKSGLSSRNLALKNGRLAQKLVVRLKYGSSSGGNPSTGTKVDQILCEEIRVSEKREGLQNVPSTTNSVKLLSKSTHPFFLGKRTQQPDSAGMSSTTSIDEAADTESVKPVAWKDIVFKTSRPANCKNEPMEKPLWPPIPYHHVGTPPRLGPFPRDHSCEFGKQKSKASVQRITEDDNVLSLSFRDGCDVKTSAAEIKRPERLQSTAADALNLIFPDRPDRIESKALSIMRAKSLVSTSPFDRAEPSGSIPWVHQFHPSTWEEVLQPKCHRLYEWLSGLAVHNVKQGLDIKQTRQAPKRRKRLKRQDDEFGDFIDFEEDVQEKTKIKNAVLIVGPNGCGKTASVYTVAKQLGFEVFEIHPGMRRSQKDIFDKVGDMTQNHMVRGGQMPSRDSSVLPEDDPPSSQEEVNQPSMTSFFVPPSRKRLIGDSRGATPQPSKQEQKQSLILFEEVDHVFDEDRGFWSGVQALIQNSKRPVVLTCNDTRDIPLNDLDLYTTLVYSAPPTDVVAEYLCYLAAAEGHILQPDATRMLYQSKGHDLRAAITELDFWCQMTVGSTQGGLDWFPSLKPRTIEEKEPKRTFSKNTYYTGLDLLPASCGDLELDLGLAGESLDVGCAELLEDTLQAERPNDPPGLTLAQNLEYLQTRSDAEYMHESWKPALYALAALSQSPTFKHISREQVVVAKTRSNGRQHEWPTSFQCLEALAVETSINSLGHGRLAPSLDGPRSVLASDVAPYVRSIAAYDERLEQQRDELFFSQGKKTRNTRAARAAAEGGDKASTRRERWFSEKADLYAILETGNNWPQWSYGEMRHSTSESHSVLEG